MEYRGLRRTLYKNARFDAVTTTERARRRTEIQRKEGRERDIQNRRNFGEIEASPSPKPVVKKELTRREKLLRWKAEKEAILIAEKAKKKPPFKVGAFPGLVVKETTFTQPPKSTVKKAAKDRSPIAAKKQTVATKALSALSTGSEFRRVTRSQAKFQEKPIQPKNHQPVMSNRAPSTRKKPSTQVSFAPANHVFKPPINLTFPVTPDLMKRGKRPVSKQPMKPSGLLAVPGVKPLEPSTKQENLSKVKPVEPIIKPANVTESSQGTEISTVTIPEATVTAKDQPKSTPSRRRSTRLATPKPAPDSTDDSGVSPSKQMKTERQNPKEENKEENKGENKGENKEENKGENKENQEKKQNEEDDENRFVANKISRMSIHSPTCVEIVTTPEQKLEGALPAQFSPFIVTGRGSERHKNRRSRVFDLGNISSEDLQKAEQVKQFRSMLETDTNHLLELSDKWEGVKNAATEDLPSDAQEMILAAVGQARLLTKDKFQQFKRLIDKFELGTAQDEKMTADDLTGFWEMVQVTVKGLKNQFKKLSDLQSNGWKEEVKIVRKKPAATVLAPRVNNVRSEALEESQARFREFMAAARKKRRERKELSQNKSSDKTFDGVFFKVESPKCKTENVPPQKGHCTPNPLRKSLLQTVLTNSANRVVKSPSVSKVSDRIRVSLVGRRTSLSRPEQEDPNFISPIPSLTAIPSKSILKSVNKSAKRRTVVFNQAEEGSENADNLRQMPRRSLRFNVDTKFDDSAN